MDAEGFIGIRSLRYLGTPVFSALRISSCDMVALSQREPNFWSRTWKFTLRDEVVHIVALQQFIFNAGSAILERMIHSLKI